MATGDPIARGQITVIDQNDAISIFAVITSNQPLTQIYNRDTLGYTPNWQSAPNLKLTPSLYLSGVAGDQIGTAGRIKPGSVAWKMDGTAVAADANHVVNANAPFDLTVKTNDMAAVSQRRFEFSAIFVDPNTTLETPFSVSVTFSKIDNPGATIVAVAYTPDGNVFRNGQVSSLRVHCDLWRGSAIDNTNVTYKWGIVQAGVFAPTTLAAAAAAAASSVTLTSVANVISGSKLTVGGSTYTVTSVAADTKIVGITPNLTAAASSGATATCPYYDADLGVNWGYITAANNFGGITNPTTNEITVPDAAVLNYETFKCCMRDTDSSSNTYNQLTMDVVSLSDMSDPITVDIVSPQGNVLKNGVGSANLTAKVWQNGSEIDTAGTTYTYSWKCFNSQGTLVSGFTKTGKTITITDANVDDKATFECTLLSK